MYRSSKSHFFLLNDLSAIGVDCKKATRPCPCAYQGQERCHCSSEQVQRYRNRISGPLLDRIDIQIEVPAVPVGELQQRNGGERSDAVRARVAAARGRMLERQGKSNSMLQPFELDSLCSVDESAAALLRQATAKLGLSARSYHRALKVARSIADLAGVPAITGAHVAEALGYRRRVDG